MRGPRPCAKAVFCIANSAAARQCRRWSRIAPLRLWPAAHPDRWRRGSRNGGRWRQNDNRRPPDHAIAAPPSDKILKIWDAGIGDLGARILPWRRPERADADQGAVVSGVERIQCVADLFPALALCIIVAEQAELAFGTAQIQQGDAKADNAPVHIDTFFTPCRRRGVILLDFFMCYGTISHGFFCQRKNFMD